MANGLRNAESEVFARRIEDIDQELVHLSAICKVNLLDPEKIERVIRNDTSVCHARNPMAFTKMRELLMLHYAVRSRAAAVLGEAETRELVDGIVGRIRNRLALLGVVRVRASQPVRETSATV